MARSLYRKLHKFCKENEDNFHLIPMERKRKLGELSEFIFDKIQHGEKAKLIVICTHNSRRSHMGQCWLMAAARYYGIDQIESFSGGVETTAFHPNAIGAMEKMGFKIRTKNKKVKNPVYKVSWSKSGKGSKAFSKIYDDKANPKRNFAALMVCNSANKACPIVKGAAVRVAIPYKDPKAFDGTKKEAKAYLTRSKQIGLEMMYIVKLVREQI